MNREHEESAVTVPGDCFVVCVRMLRWCSLLLALISGAVACFAGYGIREVFSWKGPTVRYCGGMTLTDALFDVLLIVFFLLALESCLCFLEISKNCAKMDKEVSSADSGSFSAADLRTQLSGCFSSFRCCSWFLTALFGFLLAICIRILYDAYVMHDGAYMLLYLFQAAVSLFSCLYFLKIAAGSRKTKEMRHVTTPNSDEDHIS